jgi:CDP-4-dehydro-6-deoxyglucose reductase, E1
MKKNKLISYGKSIHGKEEITAVLRVLKNTTQMGKNVTEFEKKISSLFLKKYGIMFNSGSSALLIAFEILNLPKNSEVITPVLTFGTTISSMLKASLKPVFIDIKKETLNIDEELIEKKITKKTSAICVPNLIGNLPNWPKIFKIAKKYNLKVIEDSADTLGATIDKKSSGFYSDISITSFYGSHIINGAGNGGMLCLNNPKLFKDATLLRSWGRSSSIFKENSESISNRFNIKIDGIDYDKKFIFEKLGYNLEPSEISAAFGLVQLKKLRENIRIRIKNFNFHLKFFNQYEKYFISPEMLKNVNTPWLAFPFLLKQNKFFTRKDLQIYLEKRGVQTRVIFTGNILRQPCMKDYRKILYKESFLNADYVMKFGMMVGCHHGLNFKEIHQIHKHIKNYISKFE